MDKNTTATLILVGAGIMLGTALIASQNANKRDRYDIGRVYSTSPTIINLPAPQTMPPNPVPPPVIP